MDESYDSVSLSPTQLLARMQQLRLLQEAARAKLQQHRSNSSETTESVLELLSHFSTDSTSYRTFQNLLLDSNDEASSSQTCEDSTAASHRSFNKIRSDDLIDGIAVLNLSQESEFVLTSPSSGRSRANSKSQPQTLTGNKPVNSNLKKCIELEDMPILSPRRDFETLLLEKIQKENVNKETTTLRASTDNTDKQITKKPFLRRGEGLSRFGIKKDDLIIQNTKSLPWKEKKFNNIRATKPHPTTRSKSAKCREQQVEKVTESSLKLTENLIPSQTEPKSVPIIRPQSQPKVAFAVQSASSDHVGEKTKDVKIKIKAPECKTKTWARILTHEQDAFLRQLKQSSYYKNFESPAKSIVSEGSCNESFHQLQQEREIAEQNIFELLENKVSNTSFCSESSFLHRFIMSKPDCSGNNTPMLLQKCLANNPELLQLFPPPQLLKERENIRDQVQQSVEESECSECDNETSSNTSTCCTCRTVEESTSIQTSKPLSRVDIKDDKIYTSKIEKTKSKKNYNLDQTVTPTDDIKADMAEMNSKLVATTELLKERLHELEDEIEMFRQENANLTKMREDIDAERHRFYEEKSAYNQKMNEDKVLSEYYLAEEKEKLSKQKQVYDRYLREIKGQLTRKEKSEVIKLKKEMDDLKEEFRQKDVKSTSCIARLRNQLKIIEKEKKDLKDECEKLKTENRRIQQVNTNTRRLSNLKYLAEINKKLTSMHANDKMVRVIPDDDGKYKTSEMESKTRAQKLLPAVNRQLRARAKSVPNLTVTSRYAKYFSQRDAISQMEQERVTKHVEDGNMSVHSDDSSDIDYNTLAYYESILSNRSDSEKRERETSCRSDSSLQTIKMKSHTDDQHDAPSARSNKSQRIISDIQPTNSPPTKCNKGSTTTSGSNQSKTPIPPLDLTRCGSSVTINQSKSPVSILSDRSSMGSRKSSSIPDTISPGNDNDPANQNEDPCNRLSVAETNLNPKELTRPDGSRELRFANGNVKIISGDGKTSKFIYYNGDIKETFYNEGKVKYYYAETKTYHTTFVDGLEVLQFPDGQVEKRYADGSVEIRLPNGSVRYTDPRSEHVSEEWRFPDGAVLTVARDGEQVVRFLNGQVEVHANDHKRREFPDGTVKLVYSDGTAETRYASGRIRIKDPQGTLIMDSATRSSRGEFIGLIH